MNTWNRCKAVLSIVVAGGIGFSLAMVPNHARAQSSTKPEQTAQAGAGATTRGKRTTTEVEVEEIMVTARRRAELITETPVVVTAVTGEEMAEKNIYTAEALGQLVPNVYIAPGTVNDLMFIRGVGTSGTNAGLALQVGLFIDGIYYGSGHWMNSGYFDLGTVQVLEGPQGVYFGKNTIAGAIDITTKSPGKELEGYAKMGYEFWAKERYGEAALSVPITDTLGVRVAGRASQMDGWGDAYGKDQPGIQDLVGRVTVAYKPTPDFDATAKLQYNKFKDNGPVPTEELIDCPNGKPSPLSLSGVAGTAPCKRSFHFTALQQTELGPAFLRQNSYATSLNMHYRTGNFGTLTSITGYNFADLDSLGEWTGSSFDGVDSFVANSNRAFTQEFRYLTTFDFPVNFLLGVYDEYTHAQNHRYFNFFPAAIQGSEFVVAHRDEQMGTSLAGFGEVQWKIIPSLELDVGGRYTRETNHSTTDGVPKPGLIPAFAATFPQHFHFEARQTFTDFSPQASLTWKPTDALMLYAAYRTGFLAGGFDHTATVTVATQPSDLLWGKETTKGGEVGAKFSLFDRRVEINADGYYYRYEGLQVGAFNPQTFALVIRNAAVAEVTGGELSGGWKIGQGFSFFNAVSYNRSRYLDFIGSCLPTQPEKCTVPIAGSTTKGQDFSGTPTNYAPDWTGRVELDYAHGFETPWTMLPGSGHVEMSSSVGLNWSTDYIVGNTLAEPGHPLLDANLSFQWGPWVTGVGGRNLLNEVICLTGGPRPLATGTEQTCQVARSREVHVTLSYNF